jgi:hypothetical protein
LIQECCRSSTPSAITGAHGKSPTPSRALPHLHARPLAKNSLLNPSAPDLTVDDRRSPSVSTTSLKNPSAPYRPRLHALALEEDDGRAVGSKSDGSLPIRPAGLWAGRGSGPAWPTHHRSGPSPFFLARRFLLFVK